MENNTILKSYFKNLTNKDKNKETKNKILYKFKIMDNNPKMNNHRGKCYLININFLTKNNFSLPKANTKIKNKTEKLPLINSKDSITNLNNLNTISFSKTRKELNNERHNLTKNKLKTISLNFNLNHTNTNRYKNKKNLKSSISLTEPHERIKNENKKFNDIINRINERYFIKNSTVRYLNNLFFGENGRNGLKVVNLSKIKAKNQNDINFNIDNNKLKKNKIYEYKSYINKKLIHKRLNSFNEKMNDNYNDVYKLNKLTIDEKLKNFKELKIKKCKNLIDNALKDLIKAKEKNFIFIENFRKSCDFKYEDF